MKRKRESGTVLIFALFVMLAGAFVLAACLYVLSAQVTYTEQLALSSKRRIVLENSRLLATQFFLQSVLPGSFSGTRTASVDGGATAQFTISTAGATVTPLASTALPSLVNLFSPGAGWGYTSDLNATLWDGVPGNGGTSFTWLFQSRSRNPIFGFDLYTMQKPTITPAATMSSNIRVVGNLASGVSLGANAMLWPASPGFSGTAVTVSLPSTSTFTSATNASNFAFLPMTSGTTGLSSGYDGTISTISPVSGTISLLYTATVSASSVSVFSGSLANVNSATNTPANPANGVSTTAVTGSTGTVNIDLSNGYVQSIYILGNITKIALIGQGGFADATADGLPALVIVYVPDAVSGKSLGTIELQGENNRRVYLAVKKTGTPSTVSITSTTTASHQWRLAASFENTPVSFTAASTLQITGGLRSDAAVNFGGGNTVSLVRETDPKLLERYADRVGWLEAFKQ